MSGVRINGKEIVNSAYHAVIITGLAVGYAQIGKMIYSKASVPRLDFTAPDVLMTTMDIGLALATKDLLERQGILPHDIMK